MKTISVLSERRRKEAIVAANDLTQGLVDYLNVGLVIPVLLLNLEL